MTALTLLLRIAILVLGFALVTKILLCIMSAFVLPAVRYPDHAGRLRVGPTTRNT